MPRFVRPSYLRASCDGIRSKVSTGPRSRTGTLAAVFYVRRKGEVSEALSVDMIGSDDGKTVLVRISLPDGRVLLEERVVQ